MSTMIHCTNKTSANNDHVGSNRKNHCDKSSNDNGNNGNSPMDEPTTKSHTKDRPNDGQGE